MNIPLRYLINLIRISLLSAAIVPALAIPQSTLQQKFVCNTGYSQKECNEQVTILRAALARYHAERLGSWTWVIVKSQDWKEILRPRGLDPDSPAFTYLEKHETFFEEALFTSVPVRSGELLIHWSLPANKLLDLAVTHELGHALCRDSDEVKADSFGRPEREGANPSCAVEEARFHSGKNSVGRSFHKRCEKCK